MSLLAAALTLTYPLSAVAVSEPEPEQPAEKTENTEGVFSDGDNSDLIAPINEDFILSRERHTASVAPPI